MIRERVSAVVLDNKKILLVNGQNRDFFWTPGGGVDKGESVEVALLRELTEELGVSVSNSSKYITYRGESYRGAPEQNVHCFIVEIVGEIKFDNEISSVNWFSGEDILSNKVSVPTGIKNNLIPALIKDGLL